MTTTDWISTAGVAVQLLLLGGLIVYCVETCRIRKISQAQLEALHAPCVTFHATPRDAGEAVLNMDAIRGAMILDFLEGDAMFKNIGNGAALNISYVLTPLDSGRSSPDGYISFLPDGVRCSVPISRNILVNRNYDCVIQYESVSQTRYETKLTIRNLVLTPPFRFRKAS
jgi:hypothetical protein